MDIPILETFQFLITKQGNILNARGITNVNNLGNNNTSKTGMIVTTKNERENIWKMITLYIFTMDHPKFIL